MHEAKHALPSTAGSLGFGSLHTQGALFVASSQGSDWLVSKSTFSSQMAGGETSQLDERTVD